MILKKFPIVGGDESYSSGISSPSFFASFSYSVVSSEIVSFLANKGCIELWNPSILKPSGGGVFFLGIFWGGIL